MSAIAHPRVYTIPPGAPYLATFARAFWNGEIIPGFGAHLGPLKLSSATIYVPTRRAARGLAQEFASLSESAITLLPQIVPLGQMDAMETALIFDGSADRLLDDIPDAISDIQRRLDLSSLILKWTEGLQLSAREAERAPLIAPGPAQAWQLAKELAGLIDEMTIEGVDWDKINHLAPREFDEYWEQTLRFLRIATSIWPQHLKEHALLDRAERTARLIEAEVKRIRERTDDAPVIAIGSTGSNHATAQLLSAIARAPQGAVVLPGLDLLLDDASWDSLAGDPKSRKDPAAGHPQFTLHRLLRTMEVKRADVVELGQLPPAMQARRHLLSEALRPADTTDAWQTFLERVTPGAIPLALEKITVIEATDEREEALAIAGLMREALEVPGETASLITPDRGLASRVRAELARWNIYIDDSGGSQLASTPEGSLAALVMEAALETKPALPLLALLSHPLCRLGSERADIERLACLIDIAILRLPLPDIISIEDALILARKVAASRDGHPAAARMSQEDWDDVAHVLEATDAALASLRAITGKQKLAEFATAHKVALQLVMGEEDDGTPGAVGLEELFGELQSNRAPLLMALDDYALLFAQIARETVVRAAQKKAHPRLKILGLLEARLIPADRVILAGLDETIWPPQSQTDPFLNRPMRMDLGLSSPERRIGQTAHDFMQAMGNEQIIITRAKKRGGSPTVPSRFLQRIAALAGAEQWSLCRKRGSDMLHYARILDGDGDPGERSARPQPKPPVDLRPQRLSITRIETLRRDPYSIYAEYILKLKPLEAIGAEAGARVSGIKLHKVLADFALAHPSGPLPLDAEEKLTKAAAIEFQELMENAEFRAFLWPRLTFALQKFVDWERQRRADIAQVFAEQYAVMDLTLLDGSNFKLSGVADRLEWRKDDSVVLIDYKSGRVPQMKEIRAGFSPQLTLESAMVQKGVFTAVGAKAVSDAIYIKLGGGKGLQDQHVKDKDTTLDDLVQRQFEELIKLLSQFREPDRSYVPRPFPQFTNSYGVYDHLARVQEWSSGGEGSE
jgi:ATP-dependent helicase/nuclease subunit B